MLKRFYDKSRIWFAIAWIIAYCLILSIGDAVSSTVGIEKIISLPLALVLSAILFVFLKKNGLLAEYGLCKARVPSTKMLLYFPLVVLLTANLWYGVRANLSALETVLYILTMFCVGFLEEIIFRGLLFRAMAKDNMKAAVIVSSITFGIGHIINLVNGSGAELVPNILQVIYATAAGFMFVMIYIRTESLLGCIITHGLFNALSVFVDESSVTTPMRILSCILLTLITGLYGLYIALTLKKEKSSCERV